MENAKKSCGMRQKSRRPLIRVNPGVTVDEEDYTTFQKIRSAILSRLKKRYKTTIWPFAFDLDEEKRISSLTFPRLDSTYSIPEEVIEDVMSLSALKHLHASKSSLRLIPCSIGRLKNLESLDLSYNYCLRSLPAEIGSLTHLKKLILNTTYNLETLPDTFASLQKLEVLDLGDSSLTFFERTSLPLLSLRYRSIAETVGKLTNLKELKMKVVARDLETSASRLKNLQQLSVLHLEVLFCTHVRELGCLRELPSLTTLRFSYATPDGEDLDFLDLVRSCPRLGHLNCWYQKKEYAGLVYALACNRYNHKFQGQNPFANETNRISKTLWPQILCNATSAFRRWEEENWYRTKLNIEPHTHDAVHKLLVDGRESFVQVLLQR